MCLFQPWQVKETLTFERFHPIRGREEREQKSNTYHSDDPEFWKAAESLGAVPGGKVKPKATKPRNRLTESEAESRFQAFLRKGGWENIE